MREKNILDQVSTNVPHTYKASPSATSSVCPRVLCINPNSAVKEQHQKQFRYWLKKPPWDYSLHPCAQEERSELPEWVSPRCCKGSPTSHTRWRRPDPHQLLTNCYCREPAGLLLHSRGRKGPATGGETRPYRHHPLGGESPENKCLIL